MDVNNGCDLMGVFLHWASLVAQTVKNPPAIQGTWIRPLGWENHLEKRIPGERNSYPLQYSGLKNPMDRGAWWATVHGVTKSWT